MTDTSQGRNTLTLLDDNRAIDRLVNTYPQLLDDGKFDQVADLLQHATVEVFGIFAEKREGIEKFLIAGVQRHEDGTPRTWHQVSNIIIDVDSAGQSATSVSYFTVHQELEGFPLQPISTGRYHDKFEKHDGEWRFVYRLLVPRLSGDLHKHVGSQPENSTM